MQRMTAELSESAVAAIIEDRIRTGVYAPGARLPAERDIAAEFGVSRRFVRSAYSSLVDKGLMEKLHYRRPFVAFSGNVQQIGGRPLETREQSPARAIQTIGAVLPSHPSSPGGLSIVAGIHKALADAGGSTRLSFYDTFHQNRLEVLRIEARSLERAFDDGVAGLIWWHFSDDDTVLEVVNRRRDIPIVFIDRYPRNMRCDFAGIDDLESSRIAVDYLLDLNHCRIAHLMDPGTFSTILDRAEGYRQSHIVRGIPVDENLIVHLDWSPNRMQKAFDRLYGHPKPPTALFATNDYIAYEFMDYAALRGIQAPRDLSVVGHGNIDKYVPRTFLTSIDQPFELIGRAAARLLLKRLTEMPCSLGACQQVIMQSSLVVRDSCRGLAA